MRAYFVAFLVFFDEFLEVGPRVAHLLLAGVEYNLPRERVTTFWPDMFEFV